MPRTTGTSGIDALPEFPLAMRGPASEAAMRHGLRSFRALAEAVWRLPYGRNSDRANPLLVLDEGRGTCSTRHALLAMVAEEHGIPAGQLTLGIYLMDESNTPGVGETLAAHGLEAIPEAHCYLVAGNARVDLTHPPGTAAPAAPTRFIHEEPIVAAQIGAYKVARHREMMARWLADGGGRPGMPLEEAWAAREACIAALDAASGKSALPPVSPVGPAAVS